MCGWINRGFPTLLVIALLASLTQPALCQNRRLETRTQSRSRDLPETQLELELITGTAGVNRTAQMWAELFEKLDVAVRIRRRLIRDEPGVTEKKFGRSVRRIRVVAELDPRGRITLPGRTFTLSDSTAIKEWLRELKTYGAQGSPDGQKTWGLNKQQLESVLVPLRRPLTVDPQGKDLLTALVIFTPDKTQGDLPLHITPEAKEIMKNAKSQELFPQSLVGLSRGTGLAIMLRFYGLCFQPQRTPAGNLELTIRDAKTTKTPWRIGWPFPEDRTRNQVAPNLFRKVNIDLDDQPLIEVLEAAAAEIEMPILLDYAEMDRLGMDPAKIRVSHRPKQTFWALAIRRIAFPARLSRELYIDEAGKPFVWLTPIPYKRGPKAAKNFDGASE